MEDPAGNENTSLFTRFHHRPLEVVLGVLGLFFLVSLFLDSLSLIYVIFTFVIIILIDYREYQQIPACTDNRTMVLGAALVFAGLFLDSVINLFGASLDEGLGSTDFVPLILGLLIFFYGSGAFRSFFVPLGISLSFLIISIVPTTSWGEHIHEPFVEFAVAGAQRLLELTDYDVTRDGATFILNKHQPGWGEERVTVDRGCSGFESTTYFGIFGSFLLWKLEGDRRKKSALIVFGIVGLLFINILRITILVLVYFWYDMNMLDTFHNNIGNIFFFIWVGFIWWVAFTYVLPAQPDAAESGEKTQKPSGFDPESLPKKSKELVVPLPSGEGSQIWRGIIAGTLHGSGISSGKCGMSCVIREPEPQPEIRINIEHVAGDVVLQCMLFNPADKAITDVFVELEFDEAVLRLDRIEPEQSDIGTRAVLGSIDAGAVSEALFIFEPHFCTVSQAIATVYYRDSSGEVQRHHGDAVEIEIPLPRLSAPDSCDQDRLRTLLSDQLECFGVKIFSLPGDLPPGDAFTIARSVTDGFNVTFVREFCQLIPYTAEAWYCCTITNEEEPAVIKIAIEGDRGAIQVYASSTDAALLTGLLTKLAHDLADQLKERGLPVMQITARDVKREALSRPSLLFEEITDDDAIF